MYNYVYYYKLLHVMSNVIANIKLRLRLNFQAVKFARCKGNKSVFPLPIFSPAHPPYIQDADLVQVYQCCQCLDKIKVLYFNYIVRLIKDQLIKM